MRCVGLFTSCDLAFSKRLTTAKYSQSVLLISLWANSVIQCNASFKMEIFDIHPNYTQQIQQHTKFAIFTLIKVYRSVF